MAWLPMCGELRSFSNSVNWEPMFILYCRRSMIKDYRLASEINRMAGEVNNVVVVKDQFLEELDSLGVRPVPVKMAEFLREIQMRDKETVVKLHILEREMELNARKKNLFIQKLKGVILGRPTYGWLKRLKENHAEDLEQLEILNVLVARTVNSSFVLNQKLGSLRLSWKSVRLAIFWDGSFPASASLDACFPWKVVLLVVTAIVELSFTTGSISAAVSVLPLPFVVDSLSDFWKDMVETIVFAVCSMMSCGVLHPKCKEESQWQHYLDHSIAEDLRLAGEINALCAGLTAVIDERENFFDELNVLVGRSVPEKMVEFMRGVQDKDIPNMIKLQILGREFKLRAQEKNLFIKKLKGNMDF
ncbi:hypothetical protein Tco_0375439 [Tanacetum coccineum]